jgi:Ornithine cyclodeaminase/mu-crystallin family
MASLLHLVCRVIAGLPDNMATCVALGECFKTGGWVVRVLDNADVGRLVSMAEAITAVREVFAGWLARGAHVAAVGSDMPHKQELDPRILVAAGKYVPDSIDAAADSAELRHSLEARLLEAGSVYGELTAVASGRLAGRTADDELTVADLTGLGIQDAAVAALAARRAGEHGAGRDVPLGDW